MNARKIAMVLLRLLIALLIFGVLYWGAGYLLALWKLPAIVSTIVYSILVILLVVVLIDALLALFNRSFIHWE